MRSTAGRGFVLVRGVPVERYGEEDASLAYWGLGLHLGRAVSQNAAGDLLGHVRDAGLERRDPTRAPLPHARAARLPLRRVGHRRPALPAPREVRRDEPHRELRGDLQRDPAAAARSRRRRSTSRSRSIATARRVPASRRIFSCRSAARRTAGCGTFYIGWYIRDSQRHPAGAAAHARTARGDRSDRRDRGRSARSTSTWTSAPATSSG